MENNRYSYKRLIGVVINYFNPTNSNKILSQTLLSISSYLENDNCEVLLSDGSGFLNQDLKYYSEKYGFIYIFSSKRSTFAEGYNEGINYYENLDNIKYIILSANDIVVNKNTVSILYKTFVNDGNCGCVIPYLTNSDYHLQNAIFSARSRVVPIMTLNCNFFSKEDLIKIGKVPEDLSGYFNDIVMASKLFEKGKNIRIPENEVVFHLARQTTSINTGANFKKDLDTFLANYSNLSISKNNFVMNSHAFTYNRIQHMFTLIQKIIPFKSVTNRLYYHWYNFELFITKIKNKF